MSDGTSELLERVLSLSDAEQTEALYVADDQALTRFANSQIHQNVREHDRALQVRVVERGRVGVAGTNRLDEPSLREVVSRAMAIAAHASPNERVGDLPAPVKRSVDPTLGFARATAEADPELRAEGARAVIDAGVAAGLEVSGSFATDTTTLAVANTAGLHAEHRNSRASLTTVMMDGPAMGYATVAAVDVGEIDAAAIGREAADKAARSRGATELEPGDYTVVLEPYAVATVLEYLSFVGFSALALEEGRSFMRLGERVMGENVTIHDDGTDPAGLATPIDFEGVTKRRVDLIERGIAREVVHDAATAGRAGTVSSGHALPAPNTYGPYAWNLFMAPGNASRDDLLAGIERGVWVTRFHYVNAVHPKKAILTGMTKDGTFMIEKGQVTRPILNLRFTQAIPEAFSAVEAISAETKLVPGDFFGASRVPALRIGRFTFTGVTRSEE